MRENNNIKGLIVKVSIFKIKLLADDTSLIVKDMKSVELAIREFEYFGKFSGLQINLDKTEIIPIGSNSSKHITVPDSLSLINIKIGPFKTLGIWFSKNPKEMVTLKFNKRMENIKKNTFHLELQDFATKKENSHYKSTCIATDFIFVQSYLCTKRDTWSNK